MNTFLAVIFVVIIAALIAAAAVTGVKKKTIPMIVSVAALAGVIIAAALVYKPSGNVPASENVPQSSVSSASSGENTPSSDSSESPASSSESQSSSENTSSKEQSSAASSKMTSSSEASSEAASSKTASSKAASSKTSSSNAVSSKTESRNTTSKTETVSEQAQPGSSSASNNTEKSESNASSKTSIPDLIVSSDGAVTLPFVPFEDVEVDIDSSSTAPTASQPAASRTDDFVGLDENETPILGIEEMLPDDWSDEQPSLKDGEYTANYGVVEGSDSAEAEVTLVIKNGKITDVKITPTKKTAGFDETAKKLRQQIIDEQSADVEPVTGDNVISRAILGAAKDALNSAKV